MAKFVCSVCGYVYEGDAAPEKCPVCNAPASKFNKQEGELTWAAEHVVGVAQGVSEDILADLRANLFIIRNPWAVHWEEAALPCYVQNETKHNIQAAKETWSLWRTEEVTVY